MAWPWCPGAGPLSCQLPREGPSSHSDHFLSLPSHCIQQILEAVLHCHQMGVVHRDLKVSDQPAVRLTREPVPLPLPFPPPVEPGALRESLSPPLIELHREYFSHCSDKETRHREIEHLGSGPRPPNSQPTCFVPGEVRCS